MARQNTSQHTFARVPSATIPRSSFDRSSGYKTTFDAGYLIPIFVDEALPGDTYNLKMTAFARLATPIKPVMDNMYLDSFFFAIPYRLVWDNWQRFQGEQDNPNDTTDYLIPTMTSPVGGVKAGELSDYFGIPTNINTLTYNSLHHRAYALCWNEWFRDQNIQDSIPIDKGDGPDAYTDYVLKRRNKRHDYFTSGLPFPQKGPSVLLPLGDRAPVVGLAVSEGSTGYTTLDTDVIGTEGPDTYAFANQVGTTNNVFLQGENAGTDAKPILYADLTEATAATINDVREGFQIQKLFEKDARGGTRYTEIIKAHFGVTSPDARLQRPEFLGGGSTGINVTPIPQTSDQLSGGAETPQGNLAAMGTVTLNNHGFTKSFTEHCLIIGMVSMRADLSYQQGLNRMWSRQGRFDFFMPVLGHLGEQAILNKEIYARGSDASPQDENVFAYQERYAEYRYKPSLITGQFKSNYAQSLDFWHLAQDFGNLPTLNNAFIEENPPIDRIIATQDEPHLLFDSQIKLRCARPMSLYGVPGLVDHF